MPFQRIGLALILWLSCQPAQADTHCDAEETVFFSCKIAGSSKVVSLCGSKLFDARSGSLRQDGWLQYRFGILGSKPELSYPTSRKNSTKRFKGEASSFLGEGNVRGYTNRVWFRNGKAQYAVVVDQGDNHFTGVRTFVGEKLVSLPCEPGMNKTNFGNADGNDFGNLSAGLKPVE